MSGSPQWYARARRDGNWPRLASAKRVTRHEDMRQMFRRYLSPRLADKILGDAHLQRSMLGTADLRTHAVVMFADLRGFTTLTERLAPQEVVPLLNEYFSLLTAITFQHDGTVFHMAGDCLMVGFGVPLVQDDSPERAVTTAREMLEQLCRPGRQLARAPSHRDGPRASASTKATWSPATSAPMPT